MNYCVFLNKILLGMVKENINHETHKMALQLIVLALPGLCPGFNP